ncbi:MAG: cobalamin biosynthesis central domain-containing protein, partial [Angelakisella sp.]
MKTELIAFTDRGFALAERLATELGGSATRCGAPLGLAEWTASKFHSTRGLVFVGAAGIAVRAIAPFVSSKLSDAAVVVVDENAQFAVPILSGHLGGGNDLARQIAKLCGAQAVITTATDGRGTFAVDEWARYQGCAIANPEKIKTVSAKLLEGAKVYFHTDMSVQGELPAGVTYSE